MFLAKNGVVTKAEAAHLNCTCGTVDFSTSPPTEVITHSPDDVIKDEEGWAEAIPLNPLVRRRGKQIVDFSAVYKWCDQLDIKEAAKEFGWQEALDAPIRVANYKDKALPKQKLEVNQNSLPWEELLAFVEARYKSLPYWEKGLGVILVGNTDQEFKFVMSLHGFRKVVSDEPKATYFFSYLQQGNILVVG